MVSTRCKIAVKEVFRNLGLVYSNVELGEVEIAEILTDEKLKDLKISLLNIGFELIEDRRAILIERIKNIVIDMVHHSDSQIKINFSD